MAPEPRHIPRIKKDRENWCTMPKKKRQAIFFTCVVAKRKIIKYGGVSCKRLASQVVLTKTRCERALRQVSVRRPGDKRRMFWENIRRLRVLFVIVCFKCHSALTFIRTWNKSLPLFGLNRRSRNWSGIKVVKPEWSKVWWRHSISHRGTKEIKKAGDRRHSIPHRWCNQQDLECSHRAIPTTRKSKTAWQLPTGVIHYANIGLTCHLSPEKAQKRRIARIFSPGTCVLR